MPAQRVVAYIRAMKLHVLLHSRGLVLWALLVGLLPNVVAQTLESTNLPVLVINTDGQPIPDEPKIMARLGVNWSPDDSLNSFQGPFNHYDGWAGIEIRGSSSQLFPKKGYALELRTEVGADFNFPLLGMPAESDWVLHGPYSDKSLMRNALAYWIAGQVMQWAPRTRFCELIINGDYRGAYLVVEKIKRGPARVPVSKLQPDEVNGDALTGGYILKIDKKEGAEVGGWWSPHPPPMSSGQRIFFQYHYPKPSVISLPQQMYIQEAVAQWEEALLAPDFDDTLAGWRQYMDESTLIDFFLVNEMAKNVDAYRLSTFFYKDRDSKDPRFFMGPVWDFNLAFGNADYCDMGSTAGWVAATFNSVCSDDSWLVPFWWNRLFADQHFMRRVARRWRALRQGVLRDELLHSCIDSLAQLLAQAQKRNFERFPVLDHYVWPNNYVGGSYGAELTYLKNWLWARLAWMDQQLALFEQPPYVAEDYFDPWVAPNPSAGQFVFHYYVRQTEQVRAYIYDRLGRRVALWQDDAHDNGAHSYEWHGALAPGIYFYALFFNSELRTTGKLAIIR